MPSSVNYIRDYQQEYRTEDRERRKQRALRNRARRMLAAEGLVRKGDGMHVNHKKPLSLGGGAERTNLNVVPAKKNVSYPRTRTGAMKRGKR